MGEGGDGERGRHGTSFLLIALGGKSTHEPLEYQIVRHPSASSDNPTSPLTLQQFPVRASKCGSKSKLLETKKGLRKQAAVCGQGRNHHLLENKKDVSSCKNKREQTSSVICPQEEAGNVESVK